MPVSVEHFAELIDLVDTGKVTSRVAKDILAIAISEKRSPLSIVKERGLFVDSSLDVEQMVEGVLEAHPSVVADYRSGKHAALQFLIGQCMKVSKGAIDPTIIQNALVAKIKAVV